MADPRPYPGCVSSSRGFDSWIFSSQTPLALHLVIAKTNLRSAAICDTTATTNGWKRIAVNPAIVVVMCQCAPQFAPQCDVLMILGDARIGHYLVTATQHLRPTSVIWRSIAERAAVVAKLELHLNWVWFLIGLQEKYWFLTRTVTELLGVTIDLENHGKVDL